MAKILLSGGLGFIGSTIVRKLENTEHKTVIIDNQSDYDGAIDRVELQTLIEKRVDSFQYPHTVYDNNIVDTLSMNTIFAREKPDVVVHLAAFPRLRVVKRNPQLGCDVILKGLINLLEASVKHGVKRFVFISSSMVYGDWEYECNPENAVTNPVEPYGIMKLCAEKLVENYQRLYDLEYSIVRPSAVYGPYDIVDRVLSKFVSLAKQNKPMFIKGEGLALDFTHVDDVANGIILCATEEKAKNEIFNITRGIARTLEDASNLIIKHTGSNSSITVKQRDKLYGVRGTLDITKAKELLGYNPTIDLEQGLETYIRSWIH